MSRSTLITGIDIGTTKITCVIGQYFSQEENLNIVGIASQRALGFRKGQVVNIEQAIESISQTLDATERMGGFSVKEAVVSVSSPQLASLNSRGVVAVANPNHEIIPEDVERAIDSAKAVSLPPSREILHVIPRHYSVDGQEGIVDPVGMAGTRLELEAHIITAAAAELKNLTKCLNESGVSVQSLIYSGLATSEAVLSPTEKELGVILIDIGGSNTCVTVFTEGSPIFSTVIPAGSVNITNDLAIGLRVPIEAAEKIKLYLSELDPQKEEPDEIDFQKMGLENFDKKTLSWQTAVSGIIRPRSEEIAQLIAQQLKDQNLLDQVPAGLVITGGGSLTVGIKEIFGQILNLPVRTAQPPSLGGIADELASPTQASTLGLVLYYKKILEQTGGKSTFHSSSFRVPKIGKTIPFKGLLEKIKNNIKPLLP